jgi:eukaryotic-like serine/threonine-protein kinase
MMPNILIVEEERELRAWLRHHIEILWPDGSVEDIQPTQFEQRSPASNAVGFDLIVLGAQCGDGLGDPAAGLGLLRTARAPSHAPPVVVIATGGNELSAVRAMQLGAADYLPRSALDAQRLASALRHSLSTPRRTAPLRARAHKTPRRNFDPSHLELPQYSLLHKLGESARAAVYLAYSVTLGRNVALKISKPMLDGGEEGQEFAREYAAICALQHPAVVSIYDYGFHDGREFIAMEYFPCGDLKTRLQQPITVIESLEYAQRICAALQIVHAAGLVHRDLKPPNVMLRGDGSVVLIDFGLAKTLESAHLNTVVGVLRGSPYYMSPEQAMGQPLDARSDLYSTGVMLFEMLTGGKPYVGGTAIEVMQQHVRGQRPALPPGCAALEPLLDRFMARAREQRFNDAQAAEAALSGAISMLTPSAVQPDNGVTLQ